jgi:hypothetical protein
MRHRSAGSFSNFLRRKRTSTKPEIKIRSVYIPDGTSRVETLGFQRSGCRTASLFIEKALGSRISEQLKPAFYQQSEQHQQYRYIGESE